MVGYGLTAEAQGKKKSYVKAGAISEASLSDIKTVAAFNAQSFVSTKYNKGVQKPSQVVPAIGTKGHRLGTDVDGVDAHRSSGLLGACEVD